MKKIEYILKHNKVIQAIYVFTLSLFFKFLGLFIRPRNYILFQSLIGKNYGDSPKAIYDYMSNDPYFDKYTKVWAFEDPDLFSECQCQKIKLNSFKYFVYALKSKIWISNAGIERGLRFKHKKTIHINTDHGVAYKIIGNRQKNRNDYNFKTIDLFCCCSPFDKEMKCADYKVRESAAAIIGYPVNDKLYNVSEDKIIELKNKFNIPENKKIILYAPTWRDVLPNGEDHNIPPIDLEKWKKELSNNYVIFFRIHHLATKSLNMQYDDFIRDGYTGCTMEEMVMIADILISDYSAIMFNYAILERPIVAFVYDNDSYQADRGTYISPFEMFEGSCFMTEDDVIKHIITMDYDFECEKTKNLKNKYMQGEGKSTEYCINFLKEKLK